MKKSVTLIELIIAVSLLAVIILAVTAFSVASHRFYQSSKRKMKVLNELTYLLEHINKNVSLAIGDINNPGVVVTSTTLQIRQDIHSGTRQPNNTPEDYNDDTWVEYRVNTNDLDFCPIYLYATSTCSGAYETLSLKKIVRDAAPNDFEFTQTSPGGVSISNLKLRYDATKSKEGKTNPQAEISIISFVSMSHSTN
ncbi:MAG: prepilin-type N-terminal cleavage/methylation domain-containing protein [Candidatus Omnitrophica bacterium]|nr:prepilin-type N-terminal cleavage/methylation domain-containing protein [Candidatus Omnitrophota bacterium]